MDGTQKLETVQQHLYGYKGWQRALYALLGVGFAAGGLAAAFVGTSQPAKTPLLIATAFFLAFGVYLLALGFRSRLIIEGTRIEVRGVFRERSADRSEIEGFRTVSSRNGSFRQLILKQGRGTISIQSSFNTDDDYRAWFQQIPDLDQWDREALLAEIENQQDLGATPEERLGALARAKQQSIGLLLVTGSTAVGLNLAPQPWLAACAAVLILAPFAAAYLCWRSPLQFAVMKRKADPRAETSFVLMVAGFGLLFRMRELHFISIQPLAASMITAGLAIAIANYQSIRKGANQGAFIAILFLATLYAYNSAAVADVFFDNAPSTRYTAEVIGGHVSNGRSTTYYLRLAPWGPLEKDGDVSVPSRVYSEARVGDTVCFDLYPGRSHAPWFRLASCSAVSEHS